MDLVSCNIILWSMSVISCDFRTILRWIKLYFGLLVNMHVCIHLSKPRSQNEVSQLMSWWNTCMSGCCDAIKKRINTSSIKIKMRIDRSIWFYWFQEKIRKKEKGISHIWNKSELYIPQFVGLYTCSRLKPDRNCR